MGSGMHYELVSLCLSRSSTLPHFLSVLSQDVTPFSMEAYTVACVALEWRGAEDETNFIDTFAVSRQHNVNRVLAANETGDDTKLIYLEKYTFSIFKLLLVRSKSCNGGVYCLV